MKKSEVHITDHALVRYLERAMGVDVEGLRRRIGRQVDMGILDKMPVPDAVVVNGIRYRLHGKRVTTCMPVKQRRKVRRR